LVALLNEARHSIQMTTAGPQSIVVPQGRPHEYFESCATDRGACQSQLRPAVDMFAKQTGASVAIRTADFHDRYIFIDGRECHKSGGSFKDGAANDPASLSQIVDAFDATLKIYEGKWSSGKVERP
jgi:hypothetical protein